jgi:GT2 family glycosyltransferase
VIGLEAHSAARASVEVSVIIITYGARKMTMHCLESVARQAGRPSAEVIIVDNGSSGGLVEEIMAEYANFRVVPLAANTGFAAAANVAADVAGGRYLLFLNPDTVVLDQAVDQILDFASRRPRAGIWGGQTLFEDGRINPTSCRRSPNLWRLFCTALALDTRFPDSTLFAAMGYGGWRRDNERCVDVICGSFMLVGRAVWDRLGGFSPSFFMYGEDEEFCLRARRIGFSPAFSPLPNIIHSGSGTEPNQERKIRHLLASRALLIRAYFSPVAIPLALLLLVLRPWLGRRFSAPPLRAVWSRVWAQHRLWLAGQFE